MSDLVALCDRYAHALTPEDKAREQRIASLGQRLVFARTLAARRRLLEALEAEIQARPGRMVAVMERAAGLTPSPSRPVPSCG